MKDMSYFGQSIHRPRRGMTNRVYTGSDHRERKGRLTVRSRTTGEIVGTPAHIRKLAERKSR
jgi:hypothetical protein